MGEWAFPFNGRSHLMGVRKETIRRRLSEETIRRGLFEGVAHTIFLEWRTRYFFGSGAYEIFWLWRTRYFWGWYLNLVPELWYLNYGAGGACPGTLETPNPRAKGLGTLKGPRV